MLGWSMALRITSSFMKRVSPPSFRLSFHNDFIANFCFLGSSRRYAMQTEPNWPPPITLPSL